MINISKNDIDLQTAINAHNGLSYYPEKRGEAVQQSYFDTMQEIINDLTPLAKSEEQKQILKSELERFKINYINKINVWLSAKSRCMSSMITGPANFPVSKNRDKMNAEQARFNELTELEEKATRAIKKKLNNQSIEDGGGILAVTKKELKKVEEWQEQMKATNKIIRKKNQTEEETRKRLKEELKFSDKLIETIFKVKNYAGQIGFAGFQLTNNNSKIKRLKQKVKDLERMENATEEDNKTVEKDGVKIVKNIVDNRLQLIFPDKPSLEMRTKLKSNGFRWSPRNTAWQRILTNNALYSLKFVFNNS